MTVKGPKGTLERELPAEMSIKEEDGQIVVTRPNDLDVYKRQVVVKVRLVSDVRVHVHLGANQHLVLRQERKTKLLTR